MGERPRPLPLRHYAAAIPHGAFIQRPTGRSDPPEAELHHIRMHAVKPPFAKSGRLWARGLSSASGGCHALDGFGALIDERHG